jgi:hypothetical protein
MPDYKLRENLDDERRGSVDFIADKLATSDLKEVKEIYRGGLIDQRLKCKQALNTEQEQRCFAAIAVLDVCRQEFEKRGIPENEWDKD